MASESAARVPFDFFRSLGCYGAVAVLKAPQRRLGYAELVCKFERRKPLFNAISAQNFVGRSHNDTYGIVHSPALSIHDVSHRQPRLQYDCGMDKKPHAWLDWGNRFRAQAKEKGRSLAQVAALMISPETDEALAESTLRSWTNGTRQINLSDFFWLCDTAEVDPAMVLFGQPMLTEVQREALGALTASLLEADPTASPNYEKFTKGVQKSVRAHKAAQAKAASRLKT